MTAGRAAGGAGTASRCGSGRASSYVSAACRKQLGNTFSDGGAFGRAGLRSSGGGASDPAVGLSGRLSECPPNNNN